MSTRTTANIILFAIFNTLSLIDIYLPLVSTPTGNIRATRLRFGIWV
jgi:hypothetical protein